MQLGGQGFVVIVVAPHALHSRAGDVEHEPPGTTLLVILCDVGLLRVAAELDVAQDGRARSSGWSS